MSVFHLLCGQTHTKTSQLGIGQVTVEAKSTDTAIHHYFLEAEGVFGVIVQLKMVLTQTRFTFTFNTAYLK